MLDFLLKSPMAWAGVALVAVIVALLFLLGAEKNAHAGTRKQLADEMALVATLRSDYAKAAIVRNQAVSEALQTMQDELRASVAREADLQAVIDSQSEAREKDRREADTRLNVLEAENDALKQWNNVPNPDGIVRWMREPVEAAPAPAGNRPDIRH